MSLDHLPDAGKKRVCVACKAFKAECQAPVGEDSAAMCWLCAHHVVDHGVPIHEAAEARCECTPDKVYPAKVLEERALYVIPHGDTMPKMKHPKDWMTGHFYNAATKTMDTVVRGEVVAKWDLGGDLVSDRPDRLKKH